MCNFKTSREHIVLNNIPNSRDRDENIIRSTNRDLRLREEISIFLFVQQIRNIIVQRINEIRNKEKFKHCIKNKQIDQLVKPITFFKYIKINSRLAKQVQREILLKVIKSLITKFNGLKSIS